MKLPEQNNTIMALIDKHHEYIAEPPRPHMGCSQLGNPCDRALWLSFRWAVRPVFPGRILRLFRRGQNEEATIISDLRAIGLDVRSSQTRVDFDCHVSGSLDAIIESGVPGAPKTRHVAEFKTHSKKSFDALEKDGVEKSKPEHFVQMQVYMLGTKIDRALYLAVCKDDDRIYTERIRFDREAASKAVERGQRIALQDRMPEPLSADPSWYLCKWCNSYEFCHQTKTTKEANCRTCAHVTPLPDSTWRCERWDDTIPLDHQRKGCDAHVIHPDLVPWPIRDGRDQWTAVYVIDGKEVANGTPDADTFSSAELLAAPDCCANMDKFGREVRAEFGARVVANEIA
jgi:hypothetical protein